MTDICKTNRIYLTYKCRILAEAKLRLYSRLANALIIWYSFLMIVASIAQASEEISFVYFELIFASASVAIFASSIFIATGVLTKRADEFRACYLELQGIYNSDASVRTKMQKYNDALPRYPNHSDKEHSDLVFDAWWRDTELFDATGKLSGSFASLTKTAVRKSAFWLLVCLLFAGPLLVLPILITLDTSGN